MALKKRYTHYIPVILAREHDIDFLFESFRRILGMLQDREVLVTVASGNFGVNVESLQVLPSMLTNEFDNLVSVGGYIYYGEEYSYLPGNHSDVYVDVLAPFEYYYNDEARFQGTSFGSPLVMGIAVMVDYYTEGQLSTGQIKN